MCLDHANSRHRVSLDDLGLEHPDHGETPIGGLNSRTPCDQVRRLGHGEPFVVPARRIKQNVTVQDDLGEIRCPTLIVHGAEDFIVPAAPELAGQLIPDARIAVIPDSGHYPFIEQPEAFTRTLRAFIEDTRRDH
ncbi:alpha/beta fold hydrolase [bacterium]|nr:alpha/beta fold hydrolase [bacterium]